MRRDTTMNLQSPSFTHKLPVKPLTLALALASVLVLAGLGLAATRSQAADATKPAAIGLSLIHI